MRFHPVKHKWLYHAGVDLSIKDKAPIKAFVGGQVLYAGQAKVPGSGVGNMGNVVVVKASDNTAHVYAHLDTINVTKGAFITKGDVVGTQGNTGISAGSHLHYEIRKKSSPLLGWTANREKGTLDPYMYLSTVQKIVVEKPKATTVTHKIIKGQTLSKVADLYKTTVPLLLKANPDIKDANKINIGQVIKLP